MPLHPSEHFGIDWYFATLTYCLKNSDPGTLVIIPGSFLKAAWNTQARVNFYEFCREHQFTIISENA